MKLLFQNSRGEERVIAEPTNREEISKLEDNLFVISKDKVTLKEKYDSRFLWTLEKNKEAIHFYKAHGFNLNGKRQLEEGTPEYIVMLERD